MSAAAETKSAMLQVAPYFLVEDVFATAEYYRDVLGFTITGFYGEPPSFTIMRRDGVARARWIGANGSSCAIRTSPRL